VKKQERLGAEDRLLLLQLARKSIEAAVRGEHALKISLQEYSPDLQEEGAAFVTLTRSGRLRGCIGAIEAYQPLVQDVCEHAAAAATEDFRFDPVQPAELADLKIEISRLTRPIPLRYSSPEDLLEQLHPGVDGMVVKEGFRRATFLPQVWEKIPDKREFLSNLCMKMGAPANYWLTHPLEILIYQVEEFHD
jgi:AmmeMemoRadiSam system protein A